MKTTKKTKRPKGSAAKREKSTGEREETPPPVVRTTLSTAGAVLDASIDAMALAIDTIRADIELISQGKGGASRHDRASRIAYLAAKAGSIAESMRKHEAARLKRLEVITPALAIAWLRQLATAERLSFLREASQIDARKSGLA
jgi:hypothetical protein